MADFILLATADWDHPLWTNKQHVAMALVELGHRVLYVDSLGLRGARSDQSDIRRILKRLCRGLLPPRQIKDGLWVWSPLVIPGGTSGLVLRLNRLSLGIGMAVVNRLVRLRKPLLWSFNPFVHDYLPLERFHGVIYHCVDRVQAQPGMPAERLDAAERELCRQADVVFTTAPGLQEALAPFNSATYCFGNVADADHFSTAREVASPCPPELLKIPVPRLMFIGAIDAYKLDLPLLEDLARTTPEWNYVLIGPVGETDPGTDVRGLQSLPNVHLLGPRTYASLPLYLAHADVALLPLRVNDYTCHMFPMKFFEYLAAGCQVVGTAIPALLDQGDVAMLQEPDPVKFRMAITKVLAGEGPSLVTRLGRAALHTYRQRTQAMLDILEMHGLLPVDASGVAPLRHPRR